MPTKHELAQLYEVGVTTTSSAAITADELITLIDALKRPYRKNAALKKL